MKNSKFDELDFGKILEMDCPPYLEEEPDLVENLEEEFEEGEYDDEPLDRILDIFKNRKKNAFFPNLQRRKGNHFRN